MQKIADADTPVKKRGVELKMMMTRMSSEMKMKEPIDDEYGVDRINAMIADINAEYAARIKDARAVDDEEDEGGISEGF
jgi:hypothetical protein